MGTRCAADMKRLTEYLAQIASRRGLVTYTECMAALGITDRVSFFDLLGGVQRDKSRLGCDLSALVVSGRTRRPGKGWERGAVEDWESAVARCYQVHARPGAQEAAVTRCDDAELVSARGLPYDPGNAGDLLKHGWLAAIVPWLLKQGSGVFSYADSFAGEWDYGLLPSVADRLSRLQGTPLAHYSRVAWDCGRYLGSTGLVGRITSEEKRSAEIWVGDKNGERVARLVAEHGCHELREPHDGYAVLKGDARYDLLLLDPFAGFLGDADALLPQIVSRSRASSIMVFVLAESSTSPAYERYSEALHAQCRACDALAIAGGIPPLARPAVRGESRYLSEVVFIPRLELGRAAVDQLLPQLACFAVRVAAVLGNGAEARVRMEGY